MRFKVGSKWYYGERVPIMVELTDKDKENIRDMEPQATRYCVYPDDMSPQDVRDWMEEK